jgi:hypothetical protein
LGLRCAKGAESKARHGGKAKLSAARVMGLGHQKLSGQKKSIHYEKK